MRDLNSLPLIWIVTLSFLTVPVIARSGKAREPENRITVRAPNLKNKRLVIQPRLPRDPAANQTPAFQYTYHRQKLALSFAPGKPGTTWRRSTPFAIQLEAPGTLTIEPSTITLEDWPANMTAFPLKVSGAAKGRQYPLKGIAVFNACDATKNCKKFKTSFEFTWTP
ncbi:MAG TPA: hypothetical protein DCS07_01895 [Bdellovibrionales bacterium]|nr:MAG: hypothetical protein A2Z97_07955 [Bdellovibrionales bacterium GWB1_52_6]OFZ05128.1 MAG: hypothetical protein A2X97_09245 [Bdellovibrionales bacterium GWA1_52_35]OFZ34915.1 MAG: hypothetical protein A2070_02575 [Bdellovibrionales bacterium GWC1_52_8]HAR41377.1 hypothetical protein [Bdellovibrionales bacterium]HCM38878.1 hypothetical protein [Bdellovibrionales bacterium]